MANIKRNYGDFHYESGIAPSQWINKKFHVILEEAQRYDARPYVEVNLTGRVFGHYDRNQLLQQLAYSRGAYYESLPVREKVTQQRVNDEVYYQLQQVNKPTYHAPIVDLEVPHDQYEKWSSVMPGDSNQEFDHRRNLIDSYLKNFSVDKVRLLKYIMAGEKNTHNYLHFLDMDPSTMNESQTLIYTDIIHYYETLSLNEIRENQELVEQMQHSRDAYVQSKLDKDANNNANINQNDKYETISADDLLFQRKTVEEDGFDQSAQHGFESQDQFALTTTDITPIEEEQTTKETHFAKPNIIKESLHSSVLAQTPKYETVPNPKPTLVKQNAVINSVNSVNSDYSTLPAAKFKNIFNVPQCYTIVDLIAARHEAETQNQQLINAIIEDQVNTNNSFTMQVGNFHSNVISDTNSIPVKQYR